jgi:tRNA(Ile)-lysidine synthase
MRLRRLEPVLRRALRGPCHLPRGSRLIVAASGGADSTALLLGTCRIAREFGLEVHAAHLHHGLRGADADGDLAFVRDLCARHAIPLIAASWDTRARMRRRGLAGQNGLRVLRSEFLRACARRAGAVAIATAHTADDQLETLLMRLGRGTGLRGLGGMRPRRGLWIKPMLEATRAEAEADLGEAGQTWREDASNRDPTYLRARIRHEAVPALLRALDPEGDPDRARAGLARRAARAAAEARASERVLARLAGRALGDPGRPPELFLDAAVVGRYPTALKRAILRRFWRAAAPAGVGLPTHRIEALERLVDSGRGGSRVALPEGFEAVRRGSRIRLGGQGASRKGR